MKYIISESQYKILSEQTKLVNIFNGTNFILNITTFIRTLTRSIEHVYNSNPDFEKIQSLLKQSLAGGKKNLSEEEMNIIRKQQRIILNTVAVELGYNNWEHLKQITFKELNTKIKQTNHK